MSSSYLFQTSFHKPTGSVVRCSPVSLKDTKIPFNYTFQ